ncbi:MAG: UBA/THIF-type binding protein [Frankiales bacterium]|nr:UBA/THIF-type binding protein [Frankiales bacterium]
MRPVLVPAARLLWRDQETLQLGRSVVVEGLDRARRTVLPLLDGTRTREEVLLAAPCDDAEELLLLLEDVGLLVDVDTLHVAGLDRTESARLAPDVASLSLVHGKRAAAALLSRRAARVVVHGGGRVGGAIASLLSAAGVGTVDVVDHSAVRPADTGVGGLTTTDLGRSRGDALNGKLSSAASDRTPDLVVLTDHRPDGKLLVLAGTPHLVARVEGTLGLVGPLVLPGSSPCLRCLDLVRTALDPAWPMISAQLDREPRTAACDGVLAMAVASQAALQALQLLEGGSPGAIAGTLELELPGWRWRRRSWPQHPGCPCAWALAATA